MHPLRERDRAKKDYGRLPARAEVRSTSIRGKLSTLFLGMYRKFFGNYNLISVWLILFLFLIIIISHIRTNVYILGQKIFFKILSKKCSFSVYKIWLEIKNMQEINKENTSSHFRLLLT